MGKLPRCHLRGSGQVGGSGRVGGYDGATVGGGRGGQGLALPLTPRCTAEPYQSCMPGKVDVERGDGGGNACNCGTENIHVLDSASVKIKRETAEDARAETEAMAWHCCCPRVPRGMGREWDERLQSHQPWSAGASRARWRDAQKQEQDTRKSVLVEPLQSPSGETERLASGACALRATLEDNLTQTKAEFKGLQRLTGHVFRG